MRRLAILAFVFCGILILAAVLAVPIERLAIPAWRVQVLDETGRPVPRVNVHEEWKEFDGYFVMEDERITDDTGWVSFPERRPRTRVLYRIFETEVPIAHAWVCWNDKTGDVDWERTTPQKEGRLVIRPGGCPYG
jgi:hypothetical protein